MRYYNRLIDDLLAAGVSPMVTLYHFDLPQALQDGGGWTSPAIAGAFNSYAKFCFQTFGDRVKLWITINEPYVCAKLGHEDGVHAPGLKEPGTAAYLAGHNMLRAHAAAWHSYDALYRAKQEGAVSLAINSDWLEPLRAGSSEDRAATERCRAFTLGWFAWPLFVTGDYPEAMRSAVAGVLAGRAPRFGHGRFLRSELLHIPQSEGRRRRRRRLWRGEHEGRRRRRGGLGSFLAHLWRVLARRGAPRPEEASQVHQGKRTR